MPFYPDKRGRYVGVAPWDFGAGMGRADNPTKVDAKTTLATRVPDTYEQNEKGEHVLVPGNKTPRDNFRVTTASKPAQPHPAQPPSPQSPEYAGSESLTKPTHGPSAASPVLGPSSAESSAKLSRALVSDGASVPVVSAPIPYNEL